MKLKNLVIFKAVCDEMNMTKAGKQFGMTQPSVSQIIKDIEEHYGLKLFDRISRKLYLTDAGEQLLKYTNRMMEIHDEMEEVLDSLSNRPVIKVGAIPIVGAYCLPEWIASFLETSQATKVHSRILNRCEIEELLLKRLIDIGLVDDVIDSENIETHELCKDELVVICHRDHPLANMKPIDAGLFEGEEFWIYERNSNPWKLIQDTFNKQGIAIEVVGESNGSEGIVAAVENNLGLGIVSKRACDRHENVCCLNVSDLEMKYTIGLAYRKEHVRSNEVQEFVEYLKKS